MKAFKEKIRDLFDDYEKLVTRKNIPVEGGNGIFTRYQYPVLTAAHTPVFWRYDLDLSLIHIYRASAKWPKAVNSYERTMLISNRYVEDGSYLKLKNLSIGYTWRPKFKMCIRDRHMIVL